MKKISFLNIVLCSVMLASCGNKNTGNTNKGIDFLENLNSYSIAYTDQYVPNTLTLAKDLKDAIKVKYNVDLDIIKSENELTNCINLGFGKVTNNNAFRIRVFNDKYTISGKNQISLNEGCRYFLENGTSDAFTRQAILNETYEYDSEKFKIMSYNVRNCDDNNSTFPGNIVVSNTVNSRAPRVAKNILDNMPDSVGVQEATVSDWCTRLGNLLFPTYGYVGFGRDAGLGGEASGIFYNRSKLVLVDANTKWFSETPDVPGAQYQNMPKVSSDYNKQTNTQDAWQRVFTYAIFKRISDGKFYMHINSHFDLATGANLQNAIDEVCFANGFKESMPVFYTADFNAWANAKEYNSATENYEAQGVNYLLNNQNLKCACFDATQTTNQWTYPVDYYGNKTLSTVDDRRTIDYIFANRKGVLFDKYQVLTDPVKAGSDTNPGCTSDHYPVLAEGYFVEPLISFENPYQVEQSDIMADNTYVMFDEGFNYLSTSSTYSNRLEIKAVDSNVSKLNSAQKPSSDTQSNTFTPFGCVGWSGSNNAITYAFSSENAGKCDLDLVISRYRSRTDVLSTVMTLEINGVAVNLSNINMHYTDANQYYEWDQLVIKNVNVVEGKNTVKLTHTASSVGMPNQLMLNVFSDLALTTVAA